MFQDHFEVCVLGGGPAGSAAALRLAALGRRVALLERCRFPRQHVGEALTLGAIQTLRLLGLFNSLPPCVFLEATQTAVCWEDAQPRRLPPGQGGQALVVDRASFDAHLLQQAERAGVRILQPAQARAAVRHEERWQVDYVWRAQTCRLSADHLVDATGRNGFLYAKRHREAPSTLALCGHLRQPAGRGGETLIEALEDSWCWGAPLPQGRFSAMAFVDPQPTLRRHCLDASWRSCLSRTKLFASLAALPLAGPIIGRDATPSYVLEPIGAGFVRVGEASHCLDPLSSAGVEKALRTGLLASVVLNTVMRKPERSSLCWRFYRERHREAVVAHARWSAEFYRSVTRFADQPFWRSRSAMVVRRDEQASMAPQLAPLRPSGGVWLSAETRLVEEACLLDDEIVARPALMHPVLDRPIAFLDGLEVSPLLDTLASAPSLADWLVLWSSKISPQRAQRIAIWLLSKGIVGLPK